VTNRNISLDDLVPPASAASQILGHLMECLVVLDRGLRVVIWNASLEALTGICSGDAVGRDIFELMDSLQIRFNNTGALHRALEGESTHTSEKRISISGREHWLVVRISPLRNAASEVTGVIGLIHDVTAGKRAEMALNIERDLALRLGATSDLAEALACVLEACVKIDSIESGGIYLVDDVNGAVNLIAHRGLSSGFISAVSRFEPGTPQFALVVSGKSEYFGVNRPGPFLLPPDEGLRSLAIIPITTRGKVVACLNLASHTAGEISAAIRESLESIAAKAGPVIARTYAESTLRKTERNFQALFDELGDFLFIGDSLGRIKQVNAIVVEKLGYSPEELIGQPIAVVHPRDRRDEACAVVAAMLAGQIDTCRVPLLTKDGRLIPVETKITQGKWGGQPALLGISRDVTERERTARALEESRRKYRAIFDQSPIAIEFFGSDGRLLQANQSCLDMFGVLDPQEIRGFDLFDDPNLSDDVKQALLAGQPVSTEICFSFDAVRERRLYGTSRTGIVVLDFRITPLLDGPTRIGYVAQLQDITRRKTVEARLREEEERLELVLEGSHDGFWDWDNTTGNVSYGGRWAEMLGYERDEIVPHVSSWEKLVHPEDHPQVMHALTEHLEGRSEMYETEHRVRTKSGTWKWILDRGKVVSRDADGRPLRTAGTHSDITERKEREAERERLIRELQEANARIRTLSGLLPICSACKKIRDDQGYWNHVEIYVQRFTDAQFTHGMCPDCMRKLFPELH
jgi:two-component system, cell cycle sensor histidine kinase and response regulator CckA